MTSTWNSDTELFALMRTRLFTAVVGDILDTQGYLRQFLPATIKPLDPAMIVAGRAMPVLEADWVSRPVAPAEGHSSLAGSRFGLMFRALDDLQQGEVYVAGGGSFTYALWGGLMSTRAMHCGAAGAVLHGYSRDTREILALGFPTFSCGSFAQDQGPRGKVLDWRIPIQIEGIDVCPGDIIFGDRDGVLVVPQALTADVFRLALEKVSTENRVRAAIEAGMSTVEAYERFGVM